MMITFDLINNNLSTVSLTFVQSRLLLSTVSQDSNLRPPRERQLLKENLINNNLSTISLTFVQSRLCLQ